MTQSSSVKNKVLVAINHFQAREYRSIIRHRHALDHILLNCWWYLSVSINSIEQLQKHIVAGLIDSKNIIVKAQCHVTSAWSIAGSNIKLSDQINIALSNTCSFSNDDLISIHHQGSQQRQC